MMKQNIFTLKLFFWALSLSLLLMCACSPSGGGGGRGADLSSTTPTTNENEISDEPADPSQPVPTTTLRAPTTTTLPSYQYEALAWESARSGTLAWSQHVYNLLRNDAKALLNARDFTRFCGTYDSLTLDQKINVAGQLIAGITRYESSYNPLSRFQESTMGIDPVTDLPVYSEGLLQLSYQDTTWAPFCQFDWEKDKSLPVNSPSKTILDPIKNLTCGVRILANQVANKGTIILASGAYWAVIKSNNANEKIDEIATIVSSLKICQ